MRLFYVSLSLLASQMTFANPYWEQSKVPTEQSYRHLNNTTINIKLLKTVTGQTGVPVLRILVDWLGDSEVYALNSLVIESSGTSALLARSKHKPKWGSYQGIIKDKETGKALYYDSIGTGKEYRKLARAISLRFPVPAKDSIFELYAENPQSGQMDLVFTQDILTTAPVQAEQNFSDLEVKEIALAKKSPALRVNIYAEGYDPDDKNTFWQQAIKVVNSLQSEHFPGVEHMSFYAVYHPSVEQMEEPKELGFPVPEFNSFLGLYYPYWDNFGRWYHIVYPTRESKFRQGLAAAPYDYPIVLVNHSGYWGVGNYMSHTAIPAGNSKYFTYLLLHEFGHFFGLNEEYEGGGRTELEFAPELDEPWSQNLTFLPVSNYIGLKWNAFVNQNTRIPTPDSEWQANPPVYGAYQGGYGDSPSKNGVSYKPGLNCVMKSYKSFCHICTKGILDVIHFDLGN